MFEAFKIIAKIINNKSVFFLKNIKFASRTRITLLIL